MFKQKSKTPTFFKRASLVAILAIVIVASFVAAFSKDDKALAATSSTINFQARLLTAAGTIVPDGQYNVEFKLYDAATSGTNVWTETRTGSDKVRVVNGYLTVNLGSVTAFGSINWDQELWLTMNIGGTSVSPSWDGEMSPRLKLTAVPYAFTAGKLVGGSGANTTTLNTGTPSGTNTISLPAESGTLCIQNSANCGFALSSGGGNYIQNQFAGAQSTASFWISGTGRAGTALQAPIFDTAAAGALGIGNTNATSINLNQDTTLASGKTLTLQGSFAMQPAANGTSAFNIKNQGGNNLLTLDTTNSRLGFNLGGTTTPSYAGTAGIELKGGLRLSAGSAAYADDYITPLGGTVKSLINIVNYDPGAFNQLIAMGLPSTANTNARALSLLDARSSAHQPTIAVLSPNQNEISGLSWDGSNTAFLVKNSSTSGQIGLNINGTNRLTATTTGVGINMTPSSSYALDVTGDVNISSGSVYRINGTTVCSATGCTPAAGSSNYIQNGTGAQTANFYIQSASASSVGAIIRGAASQTSSLLQLLDGSTGYTIAQFSNNGYLTLGSDSIAKAGQITLNDGTASNTFSTTIVVPTALTASRTITLPDETGTICIQSSTTCGFAPNSGSANYIQNQNASQQASSNFWISGNGRADTALQAPLFDTATAAALAIGTTNATAINLNKDTTITGGLTQSGGVVDIAANGASTIRTTSGALSIRANGTNILTLNTSGAGTVNVGVDNTTTINLGGGSDVARTINVGNPSSGTANQTVTVGTQHGTSVTTIQGGSSGTAVAITPASGGSVGITTTGAGAINLTSGSSISAAATTTGSVTAGGALTLTGGAASTWSTSAGALTITSAATATWSTSAGSLTVQAAGANALNLNTAGAGTVAVGDTNSTTINIGRGSDIARTISIGNAGSATAQAITIGSTGSTSTTTIQGGTGAGAIALTTGTNGSIGLTTAGTGDINLTSADAGQFTTGTGALTLTGGAASTWSTSAGALTITSAAAATWSTSAGALTVQAAGTNALNLQTGGAGTVAVGDVNSTTINIGRGSDITRAINIGTAGSTNAQTIIMGSTGTGSTTTIRGGTTSGAIALTTGTNGSIALTTAGTGNISLTSTNAGSFTTAAGALTLTSAAAATWSTSSGNLTVQAAGTSSLILNTVGAGTVALGDTNSTTINIGRGSDTARTINIGTAGATTAQTITIGSTGSTSTTTINGGTGAGAIALAAGTNGSITMTTTGTGTNKITSATQTVIQSSVNSPTAFQIQNQANTPIFNVDTTAGRIDVAGTIQQTGMLTSDTAGTDATKWTKLGTCTINAQYGMCNTIVNITGGNDGTDNDNTQATVTARVKQQNAMGGAPYVDVMLTGVARGIAKADLKGVTTVNSGASTVVELWGRINLTFEHWQYTSTINTNGAAASGWVWTPVSGFSAALPTGTQTDATYGTTYADTLQVAPASNSAATLSVLDQNNNNMITVDTSGGRVIIGKDDGANGADAKLYFGDVANAANPWIGEANGTDSDILQLQGKNGINFGVATTQTNVFTLSATGAVLFKNTADSTTAFQIQSQGTTPLFNIDSTSGAAVNTLYATTASTGQTINITNASGTNTNGILVNRNAAGGTTTNGLNITNTAGTLTNGLAFTGTIGTDIFRSSGILTLSGAGGIATASNVSIGLVGTPGAVLHVSSGAASDLFKVTDSTATAMDVFKIANDGYATFQNRTDSTTAFRVLKQAGNALLTVDTTSNLVNISGAGTGLGGGRLTFGDNSYAYIGEYGANDTDSLIIHGEEEIFMQTKYATTANLYIDGGTGRIGLNTEAPTETLTVVGNANVINAAANKSYRWRTSGSALDFEGGGADMYLSVWSDAAFSATQRQYLRMYSGSSRMDVSATYTYFNPSTTSGNVIDVNRSSTGTLIGFALSGTIQGSISVSGTTVSYNAFTGSHYALTDQQIDRGFVVSMTGNNQRRDPTDYSSEPYYGVEKSTTANDPKVLGSFLGIVDPGKPASMDNPYQVMSVGNGDMWVDDEGGDIQPGDYLISSNLEGYAMKDTGEFAESNIIARASDGVNWSSETKIVNGHKVRKISVLFTQFTRLNAAGLAMGVANGGIVSNDLTFNGLATFNKAVTFNNDVSFLGHVTVGDNTAGTVKIPAGQTSVSVSFGSPYDQTPKITTGVSEFVDVKVDGKSKNGFTVRIPSARTDDVYVDWTAFQGP